MSTFDVVVLGNSALGLSTAYALLKRDRKIKIAVVGPSARTGAATTTAGAMINVWAELAVGQMENAALADRAQLGMDAFGMWDSLCEDLSEFSAQPLKVIWGTYILNNAAGSPHEYAAVDYILKTMRERDVPHEILAPNAVPWLKPDPRAAISRIVRVPDGRIDPRKVLAAYEVALDALGAKRVDATATKLTFDGETKTILCSNGDTFSTKTIIFANGTYAQALIDDHPELRSATPRLVWGAGSALDLSMPDWVKKYGGIDPSIFEIDAVVRTVDRGGACGVHLVPYGDGEYYVGASAGVWFDPEPKARVHAIHVLLRSLVEEINGAFFFGMMSIRGPGFRPTTVDTFPLLGESHIKGVWFANGTKRDGFTCSPLISQQLAAGILDGENKLPKRFLPSRPLISYKNREQALDDSVTANFGGEAQHGLSLPPYSLQKYKESMRSIYEVVYEKRGIRDFGIHPELTHLYDNDDFFAAIDHEREKV